MEARKRFHSKQQQGLSAGNVQIISDVCICMPVICNSCPLLKFSRIIDSIGDATMGVPLNSMKQ